MTPKKTRAIASLLALVLLSPAALPAIAQQERPRKDPPTIELQYRGEDSKLAVAGVCDFPDGAFLDVATIYEQDEQVAKWSPGYVEGGRFACEIELAEVKIYPGNYRVDVWYVQERQAVPVIREVARKLGVQIDFRTKLGTGQIRFGTEEEEFDMRESMLARFEQDAQRLHELAAAQEQDFRSTWGSGAGLIDEGAVQAWKARAENAFKIVGSLREGLQDLAASYLYLPFGSWIYRIDRLMGDIETMLDNHARQLEIRLQLQTSPDPDLEAQGKDLDRKARKIEVMAVQESRNLAGFFHSQLQGLRVEREGR